MGKFLIALLLLFILPAQLIHAQDPEDFISMWKEISVASKKAYLVGYSDSVAAMCTEFKNITKDEFSSCYTSQAPLACNLESFDDLIKYYDEIYLVKRLSPPFIFSTNMLNTFGVSEALRMIENADKSRRQRIK